MTIRPLEGRGIMRTIEFEGYKLKLVKGSYAHDGTLAVTADTDKGETYGVLTVNLDTPFGPEEQFFDINMYKGDELYQILIEQDIIKPTNFHVTSGFVTYPLVTWNL